MFDVNFMQKKMIDSVLPQMAAWKNVDFRKTHLSKNHSTQLGHTVDEIDTGFINIY